MLLEPWCTGSITSGWHHLGLQKVFLVIFAKTRKDKSSQVMSMAKFSPIAPNFGYDFVLLVHFFGTHCMYVSSQLLTARPCHPIVYFFA